MGTDDGGLKVSCFVLCNNGMVTTTRGEWLCNSYTLFHKFNNIISIQNAHTQSSYFQDNLFKFG
ncbi:hypothetical protein Hdeb2414_s0008g00265771 [Helianthus debilis subsp. tardiflorus]